jgi:hypothetical protein
MKTRIAVSITAVTSCLAVVLAAVDSGAAPSSLCTTISAQWQTQLSDPAHTCNTAYGQVVAGAFGNIDSVGTKSLGTNLHTIPANPGGGSFSAVLRGLDQWGNTIGACEVIDNTADGNSVSRNTGCQSGVNWRLVYGFFQTPPG